MNDELKKTFDRMIDRHFRFEAEDDVDGVLSTMVDDVAFQTTFSRGLSWWPFEKAW